MLHRHYWSKDITPHLLCHKSVLKSSETSDITKLNSVLKQQGQSKWPELTHNQALFKISSFQQHAVAWSFAILSKNYSPQIQRGDNWLMSQCFGHPGIQLLLAGLNTPQNSFATYTWKQSLLPERVPACKPDLLSTPASQSKDWAHLSIRGGTLNDLTEGFEVFHVHL